MNNNASQYGGGLYADGNSNVRVVKSIIKNNAAQGLRDTYHLDFSCSNTGTCGGTGGTKVYTPDSQTGYTVTSSVDTYTNSYYFYMEYMFNGM